MADWAGKTLGKVHIEGLIARGGMAEVYTGTHETYGQVAVKVMRGLLERDSDQLARFQREAEVIEELRHPNIVQMFEYDVIDESPYLVMEYIPGPSLAIYLKRLHDRKQRLPIGLVAQILKSVASALDYAHSKGIVHRDIKPANVLLRSHSEPVQLEKTLPLAVEPVLTDFGLVRLLDSTMHTTAGSVSGTPAYMSPEQARGEKVDKRTDIYSLGIMLYEMLAGVIPFQSDTTFGMLMQHINEPPPPIQGISSDLQMLIERALAKKPENRYESAGALADEFLALFNGQTLSPGTLHIVEMTRQVEESEKQGRPQPPNRRASWTRIGAEVTLALALMFVIFRFVLFNNPNGQTLSLTPTSVNPNIAVGTMGFDYAHSELDTISFSLSKKPALEDGSHLEAWLIKDDGVTPKDIGQITFDQAQAGQLSYTDQNGTNLLKDFSQIQITKEQNGSPISKPNGEVVFSSIFPPKALVEVRNVLVSFEGTPLVPSGTGDTSVHSSLIQGLYYYSGSYIDYSVHGDINIDPNFVSLVGAFNKNDETTFRKRLEEVINLIVGDQSNMYLDYDGDGNIDNSDSDGYGSLPNGDHPGYLQETTRHLKLASDAPDATSNIREQSDHIQACIQNMQAWTNQILPLAVQLTKMSFGSGMKPTVDQLSTLSTKLYKGVDSNNSGLIEPISGECGADQAYQYAEKMAEFPIFTGPNRIPPTPTSK